MYRDIQRVKLLVLQQKKLNDWYKTMKRHPVYQEVDNLNFSDRDFIEAEDELLRGPKFVFNNCLPNMLVVTELETIVQSLKPVDSETLRCTVFN